MCGACLNPYGCSALHNATKPTILGADWVGRLGRGVGGEPGRSGLKLAPIVGGLKTHTPPPVESGGQRFSTGLILLSPTCVIGTETEIAHYFTSANEI